jgi:hypothetical protein
MILAFTTISWWLGYSVRQQRYHCDDTLCMNEAAVAVAATAATGVRRMDGMTWHGYNQGMAP